MCLIPKYFAPPELQSCLRFRFYKHLVPPGLMTRTTAPIQISCRFYARPLYLICNWTPTLRYFTSETVGSCRLSPRA
jgi:hypothetical protein